MGRTLPATTQQLNDTEAALARFRRTLRKSNQYIFDGLFAAARRAHCCHQPDRCAAAIRVCSAGHLARTSQGYRHLTPEAGDAGWLSPIDGLS